MSKQKKNKQHSPLQDFLAHRQNSGSEHLDDFEKEALEGFGMLENEEDALDLKARLDKRLYSEVFTTQTSSKKSYWYAAAGLVFLIGFTVYIVQSGSWNEKNNLAVTNTSPTAPPADPEFQEQTIPDAEVTNTDDNAQKISNTPPGHPKPDVASAAAKTMAMDAGSTTEKADDLNGEKNGKKKQPADQDVDRAEKESNTSATPANAKSHNETFAMADYSQPVATDMNMPEYREEQVAPKESNKAKNVAKRVSGKKAETSIATGTSEARLADAESVNVVYTGGEQALKKEISEQLNKSGLLRPFEATLFINHKQRVENVVFTKNNGLSSDEEHQLTAILKQLKHFEFTGTPDKEKLVPYTLKFNPE